MSKSPRSDCFWVRPPVAHIEVICDWGTPPDGSELPIPFEELLFTAKGFRSNISEKPNSFEVYFINYRTFKINVKEKNTFFAFFAKICKKTFFCCYLSYYLQLQYSIAWSAQLVNNTIKYSINWSLYLFSVLKKMV